MRLLDDLMTWQPPGSEVVWSSYQAPVAITHDDDGATITVDMPGVDSADLDLVFENGMLSIAGKRGERTSRYRVELGDTMDPDTIEARLDKGVLTVQVRKRPEVKPRKILVSAGSNVLDTSEPE